MKHWLLYIYGGYDADVHLCIISGTSHEMARAKLRDISFENWTTLLESKFDEEDIKEYYENRMNYYLYCYPSF